MGLIENFEHMVSRTSRCEEMEQMERAKVIDLENQINWKIAEIEDWIIKQNKKAKKRGNEKQRLLQR